MVHGYSDLASLLTIAFGVVSDWSWNPRMEGKRKPA